jgi:hypothetical protein
MCDQAGQIVSSSLFSTFVVEASQWHIVKRELVEGAQIMCHSSRRDIGRLDVRKIYCLIRGFCDTMHKVGVGYIAIYISPSQFPPVYPILKQQIITHSNQTKDTAKEQPLAASHLLPTLQTQLRIFRKHHLIFPFRQLFHDPPNQLINSQIRHRPQRRIHHFDPQL